jgi:hypothetical protein
VGDSATQGPWCGNRNPGTVGVWIPWCGQYWMFVKIASYFFAFIVFFAVSCLLLLGGVRLMSEPDRYPEK